MTLPRKVIKREPRSADKAENAAMLEKIIEKELLKRLKEGVYGDIYDPVKEYNKLTDDIEVKDAMIEHGEEDEPEIEFVEGYEELEEEDDIEDYGGLALEQVNVTDGSDEDDELTVAINRKREKKDSAFGRKRLDKDGLNVKPKKKSRVLVEVEHDLTDERQKAIM